MRAKEFFEKFVEKVLDDGKYPDCNQSEREFTDKIKITIFYNCVLDIKNTLA